MDTTLIGIIVIIVGLVSLVVWSTMSLNKQSVKDWDTLDYLKKKADSVSTKEEIQEFYKEFCEKASKINNSLIIPHLHLIDGYLRGMYKQYKNENNQNT